MAITDATIKDIISINGYLLLGQIEVSDAEYSELITYIKSRISALMRYVPITATGEDLKLALAMVQIAVRCYSSGNFWTRFSEEIHITGIKSSIQGYLGEIFLNTLRRNSLYFIKTEEKNSALYVENIKAHAFIIDSYISGFFDFAYSYYENNLLRELPKDIELDLQDLSHFMASTLNSDNDRIVEEINKAKKSYRLLKATRTVLAQNNKETLRDLVLPTLKMIDKYFYEGVLPTIDGRYERAFCEWVKKQEDDKVDGRLRGHIGNRLISHKPYIEIDTKSSCAKLIIPQQKFRLNECKSRSAQARIQFGDEEPVSYDLELYTSMGILISEKMEIYMPSAFDEITITICSDKEKDYKIKESDYRLINKNYECISKVVSGINYLLVKEKTDIRSEIKTDIIDCVALGGLGVLYRVNISDNSTIFINGRELTIMGEFYTEPYYENPINKFKLKDMNGKLIDVTRSHPKISFIVAKKCYNGTVIRINDRLFSLRKIENKECIDWRNDKSKYAITIELDSLIENKDGRYTVVLDSPNENNKLLCDYVYLRYLNCTYDKPRYFYKKTAEIQIKNYEHEILDVDSSWQCLEMTDEQSTYRVPLDSRRSEYDVNLYIDDNYVMIVSFRVVSFWFTETEIKVIEPDYVWYSDVGNILYMNFPNVKSVSVVLSDTSIISEGILLKDSTYRFDLSQIKMYIDEHVENPSYLLSVVYVDNKERVKKLFVVVRTIQFIDKENKKINSKLKYDGAIYYEPCFRSGADVYLDVYDSQTNELVVSNRRVYSEKNYLPELLIEHDYDLSISIEETDDFGFDVIRTPVKTYKKCRYFNEFDLVDCKLYVKSILYKEKMLALSYDYSIVVHKRLENDVYEGKLSGIKLATNAVNGRYELNANGEHISVMLGKVQFKILKTNPDFSISLLGYHYEEEEWMPMYYDAHPNSQYLVKPDSRVLYEFNSSNVDRFIELDDLEAVFIINSSKTRRIHR